MADDEDAVSDVSDKNDRETNYFKCCASKMSRIKVCVQCFSVFHQACAKKLPNLKVIDGNKIVCCAGTNEQRELKQSEDAKTNIFRMEIRYLQELLMETRDKNEILKLNNSLLLDRIRKMEKNDILETKVNNTKNHSINSVDVIEKIPTRGLNIEPYERSKITRSSTRQQMATQSAIPAEKTETSVNDNLLSVTTHDRYHSNLEIHSKSENINKHKIPKIVTETHEMTPTDKLIRPAPNSPSDDFIKVRARRRKKPRINVGTGTTLTGETTFKSVKSDKADKKLWLFISQVKESVEEEVVKEYIMNKGKLEENEVSVTKINTRNQENLNYKCVLVGVPLKIKEEIYNNEFWPKGINFARFDFRRGQHFLEKNKA